MQSVPLPFTREIFMDSIGVLNVFVQVAETRSFAAAGRALGVSASAAGKGVVRLEERLGVRLFHRNTRSVTLTPEGTLFLDRCRRILAEMDAAQEELSQTITAPRGRLRVSFPLVGEPFLPVLAEFKKAYPEVDLDLDFSDRRMDVIEEGYDAVVRSGDPDDSRLVARKLGDFKMHVVGSPAYFKEHGTPLQPEDLTRHACILFRFPNTGKLQIWPLKRENEVVRLELPSSMVCNNLEARICFAIQGVGVAFLPDFAIRAFLSDGTLVSVLDEYTEFGGTFRIMWPSGDFQAPKLRVFIDFLTRNLFPPLDRLPEMLRKKTRKSATAA
jgi:DNA-binding transcriptional LysR family regulator